jgi:hypothetical protein
MRPGFCSIFVISFDRPVRGGSLPDTHSGMIKSAERGWGGEPAQATNQTATQQAPRTRTWLNTICSKVDGNEGVAQGLPLGVRSEG